MQNGAGMKAAQSLFIGARASIEHQIDIHTNDLAEGKTHQAFEPLEVLEGLRYVMEYRIRGGRLPNMDFSLMDRLLRVLLVNMKKREKHRFIEPGSTQEAVISLELFGKFLMEVEEFRDATVKMPHTFLAHHLDFGFWASHKRPDNVRRLAATVVTLLSNALKVYHTTYEDIVRPEDGGKVDRLLSEYPEAVSNPALQFASQSDEQVLPTPRLYTEKSPKKVVDMFGSNAELGLSQEQIERLSNRYGVNKLEPPPKVSKFTMIFNQLKDFMVVILIVMSIIEFSTGSYDSGIVLMVVIVFNTVIGFYLEYRADEALSALFDLSIPVTKVLRNGGVVSTISSELIVPGDIVILEEGDSAPADIRLIECFQLKVNESFLTGENVPVSKDPNPVTGSTLQLPVNKCKCIVFMSSTITSGRAKGIVVRIGSETEIGSIGTELSKKVSKKSRLQKELFTLGIYLVVGALILCAVNAIILISYQRPLYESIKVSVTLAVSVIPEGLVAIVTGTMFIAIQRMAKKNAIVKKVHLVETLGSVTTICTDKTGTLTRGLMSLRVIYTPDDKVYVFNTKRSHSGELFDELQLFNLATQDGLSPDSDILHRPEDASIVDEPNLDTMSIELNMLIICAVFCNNASVTRHPETGKTSYIGDPTEIALLTGAIKLGATRETLQKQASFELITEFAFDSDRKMMSVIYSVRFKHKSNEIKYFVLAKGASETICLRCTGCLDSRSQDTHGNSSWTMKATELTTTLKDNCDKISLLMANDGNRVLALAYKELSREDVRDIIENENVRKAESDLTLIGFVGLKDPPRPEVKDSVARCEKAGIKVVVITGDHAATAIAIAKQLDIYDPNILHKVSLYLWLLAHAHHPRQSI